MKFSHKLSVRRRAEFREEFIRGAWTPENQSWRDIVEDYLYISRKRINNKFVLFRLQLSILQDIIHNNEAIDSCRDKLIELKNDKENKTISEEDCSNDSEYIKKEIFTNTIINRALKEVVDGMVWRLFNYNRAILYLLADKEPMGPLRFDKGMIESIYEFGDIFLGPGNIAILNDISNFLRVGDITKIDNDGNIELIEVKSSRKIRGRRIQRQKQKMYETVEFINTGIKEYDNRKISLLDSNIRQIHYFKNLLDSVNRTKAKGYDSILIGNYLILEVANFEKIENPKKMIEYFKKRHESTKDKWNNRNDLVISQMFVEKMQYSKNFIPYSILPYNDEICANIIMGRLMIRGILNISEIMRIINNAGWEIVDSIFYKNDEELEGLDGQDSKDIALMKVRKSNYTVIIPSNYLGKLVFELWSPKTMIEVLEEGFNRGPSNNYDAYLLNFLDDQRIWK